MEEDTTMSKLDQRGQTAREEIMVEHQERLDGEGSFAVEQIGKWWQESGRVILHWRSLTRGSTCTFWKCSKKDSPATGRQLIR